MFPFICSFVHLYFIEYGYRSESYIFRNGGMAMQDIIQKIIEIDRMAQKLTDETIELRKEAEASIENDKKRLREEYIEKARQRIQKNSEIEEAFLKQSLSDIETRYSQNEQNLRQVYENKHTQWAEEIYNKVLGR